MMVSSGAFFGIRGQFIGSGLALAIALGFAALMVWTSGDAIVAAAHRILHRQYWCCWPLLGRTALGCR
jgi:purine-cytosine permease-like protein